MCNIARRKNERGQALVTNPKCLTELLENRIGDLQKACSGQLDVKKVIKVIGMMVANPRNRALLDCTVESFWTALTESLTLNILPQLGRAYFVPYRDNRAGTTTCQFILSYLGMIELAHRAKVTVTAHSVHKGDKFTCVFGSDERIEHQPNWEVPRTEETLICCYVKATWDGMTHYEVMSKPEIDAIRRISKSSASGPWREHYVEMAKKTVVRRAFKYFPISTDVATAIEADDNHSFHTDDIVSDIAAETTKSRTQSLKERLQTRDKMNAEINQEPAPDTDIIDVAPVSEEPAPSEQTEADKPKRGRKPKEQSAPESPIYDQFVTAIENCQSFDECQELYIQIEGWSHSDDCTPEMFNQLCSHLGAKERTFPNA